jgi:ATP-dependent helicase STH1/SNF2
MYNLKKIADDEAAEEDEDEVVSDEVLNSMLARSEPEKILFAEMDAERDRDDKGWMDDTRKVCCVAVCLLCLFG